MLRRSALLSKSEKRMQWVDICQLCGYNLDDLDGVCVCPECAQSLPPGRIAGLSVAQRVRFRPLGATILQIAGCSVAWLLCQIGSRLVLWTTYSNTAFIIVSSIGCTLISVVVLLWVHVQRSLRRGDYQLLGVSPGTAFTRQHTCELMATGGVGALMLSAWCSQLWLARHLEEPMPWMLPLLDMVFLAMNMITIALSMTACASILQRAPSQSIVKSMNRLRLVAWLSVGAVPLLWAMAVGACLAPSVVIIIYIIIWSWYAQTLFVIGRWWLRVM